MGRDHRDMVIEAFADSEAELRAQLRDAEEDIRAYRELAQVALAAVADLTRRADRQTERIRQLCDELRSLRPHSQTEAA